MQHRRLGQTGPVTSSLGLGLMGMSDFYGSADEGESIATIYAALDAGVTLLDTGDFYGVGHNESLLGRALAQSSRREQAIVSLKFGALRDPGSGFGGYPPRLARALNLTLVDMTCSGSVTRHVLTGGQFFQDAQIRTLGPNTRLVTLTVGGNDVGFVRDLYLSAARKSDSVTGTLIRQFWSGPPEIDQRNYAKLESELTSLLHTIRTRSPAATVVVATYPTVLPAHGTCPQLRLSNAEAALMRQVESKLATVTRKAARNGGAKIVDMNALGAKHHACSKSPWTKGWGPIAGSPFHPTLAGAQATADAITAAITPR